MGTPCTFINLTLFALPYYGEYADAWADQNKPGEIWAIAISADGQYLASSSINGKINVWSLNKSDGMPRIREYETKGSFGLCVDLVWLDTLNPQFILTMRRVAMAASPRLVTRTAPYTYSTTRPVDSHTLSLVLYIPFAVYRFRLPRNCSLPEEMLALLRCTMSIRVSRSPTSQAMEAGCSALTGATPASIYCPVPTTPKQKCGASRPGRASQHTRTATSHCGRPGGYQRIPPRARCLRLQEVAMP